jgi:hypothetical protein
MRLLAILLILALMPALAFAAGRSKKHTAVVSIPTPGSFAAASLGTATDQTIGAANEGNPNVDVLDTDLPWLHMPVAATTFKPGYSVTAAAGSNNPPPDIYAVLLPGTPYEVKFKSVAVQGSSTGFTYFDPCDLIFDGIPHHFTNADRDLSINVQGATLTVNSTAGGLTCLILVLPGGETYEVAGIRF